MLRYLLAFLVISATALAAPPPRGLSVSEDGTLLLHGTPFRGIGINFVEPLLRLLDMPDDQSVEAGFLTMNKYKIPFCRVVGAGWGGPGMKLYQADRNEYFRRLDKVVRAAENHRETETGSDSRPRTPQAF
jgi:hypothetical protein